MAVVGVSPSTRTSGRLEEAQADRHVAGHARGPVRFDAARVSLHEHFGHRLGVFPTGRGGLEDGSDQRAEATGGDADHVRHRASLLATRSGGPSCWASTFVSQWAA
jgi:hypothetical protein